MAEGRVESLNTTIDRAAALLADKPDTAERLARDVLRVMPRDPRAALILGSARRRQGDPEGARAVLQPLAKAHPGAAHTHYELGLTLEALRDDESAIAALRHAGAVKRDLPEVWRALGDILFRLGDGQGADAAYAEHARASVSDPRLKPAADALFGNDLDAAERLLRDHVGHHPSDAKALQMLAETLTRRDRAAEAEPLLARCLQLDPTHLGARFGYANALFRQQKAVDALHHAEWLLARSADDAAYNNLLAGCLALVGEYDRVMEIYAALLTRYGRQAKIWLNYGHALRAIGRQPEAIDAYRRCMALAPALGDAYWSMANLKVASLSVDDEAAMRTHLASPNLPMEDRLHFNYALGKAVEDRGDYAASFKHYAAGAQLRRATVAYDADATSDYALRCRRLFNREFFDRRDAGSAADDPIFIVGLPRSGSTLIEQILASHSAVEGTMELPDIILAAQSVAAGGADYPEVLAGLDDEALSRLGDRYIETTRIHRKLGRRFFIDKMPNNFLHVGFIQLILPKARIIDARRHPLGSCFSAFKQHFAQGQHFSYDLTDLGRYYRDYVELMAHFDAVLPGRVHRVIYEELVEHTEQAVRRLLGFCGLPFETACLSYYENGRVVKTVSSEQVRRPIFREGLDRWRRYEPWLQPLKEALGPVLTHWR